MLNPITITEYHKKHRVVPLFRKVCIVQTRLTHYRVKFYELLREDLSKKGFELTLYVGKATAADRLKRDEGSIHWAIPIHNRSLKLFNTEFLWQPCFNELQKCDLVVVNQENCLLINYLLLLKRKLGGPRVAFWGHGRNLQSSNPNGIKEIWKRLWLKKADWWFAYTELTRRILIKNGYPSDRITVVNNAIDIRELCNLSDDIQSAELLALKDYLRIKGNRVGIFCGALYREKRIEFLIQAAQKIKEELTDFELIILGAGPDAGIATKAALDHSWIHYVGPKFGREKVLYMKLGHAFLMPSLVGLAILDAFALGLPLFTTDCKLHGPEISYLQDSRNGYMTPNSVESYASAVIDILRNRPKLDLMKESCKLDAEKYTLEEMVDSFASGLLSCLS